MSKWSFRSLSSSFTAKILHIYPKTPVSFVGSHVPGRPRGLVLCCNGFFSMHSIACKVARHQHTRCLLPDENFCLENVQINGPIPKVNDPIPNS